MLKVHLLFCLVLFGYSEEIPSSDFDEEKCNQVAGTDFIHWTHISVEGSSASLLTEGCTGIEYASKGTLEQAVTLTGFDVSDPTCIAPYSYTFTVVDEFTLKGTDQFSNAVTLTRETGQRCFTGHWIGNGNVYLAHVDANILEGLAIPQGVSTTKDPSSCQDLDGIIVIGGEGEGTCNDIIIPKDYCDSSLSDFGSTAPSGASYDDSATLAELCPVSLKDICKTCASDVIDFPTDDTPTDPVIKDEKIVVAFIGNAGCNPQTPCLDGQSDCETNADCQGDLICWMRNAGETRPGYDVSLINPSSDVCVKPEQEAECSEYSQQEKNTCGGLDVGEPNKKGFEFTASKSGRLHTLSLSLAASVTPRRIFEVDHERGEPEVGKVWIAIYKGRGFGTLLGKQQFTAGAKRSCCNTKQCVLHDYTFSNPIDVIESETYTVGFSLVASDNEDVSGEYDYYHHANIEDSKRNTWYNHGNRMELFDDRPFSAYFGTRICPLADASTQGCSQETLGAAKKWDDLVVFYQGHSDDEKALKNFIKRLL